MIKPINFATLMIPYDIKKQYQNLDNVVACGFTTENGMAICEVDFENKTDGFLDRHVWEMPVEQNPQWFNWVGWSKVDSYTVE